MSRSNSNIETPLPEVIAWLHQSPVITSAQAGAKARNLAILLHAGFPVPEGFCLLCDAYDFALHGQTQGLLIRDIPGAIKAQIKEAFARLVERCGSQSIYVVRSSASNEDLAGSSYAGQYETVLNVTNLETLFPAILVCWNSLSSKNVQSYQDSFGIPGQSAAMGVIVQQMLMAEASGVIFTTNPVNGNQNEVVVELVLSSPDGVEAGKVNPVRIILNKRTGRPLTGNKDQTLFSNAGVTISNLLEMAKKVEEFFGSPQDIEWAYSEGRIWILQSRPITGTGQTRHREVWTRANAGEILPGVVTPLSWAVFRSTLQFAGAYSGIHPLAVHWRWKHPSGKWPESPHLFSGRAYMELTAVYRSFSGYPGVTPDLLQQVLGFEFDILTSEELPKKSLRWHVMDPYRFSRFWLEMLGFSHTFSRTENVYRTRRDQWDQQSDSTIDCFKRIRSIQRAAGKILGVHILCTAYAFSAYGLLLSLAHRFVDSQDVQFLETGLVADTFSMTTMQHMLGLWNLARAVKQTPEAIDILLNTDPIEDVVIGWQKAGQMEAVLTLWKDYLKQFGKRSSQEFELSVARWEEDPRLVLSMLKEIVQHAPSNPQVNLADRTQKNLQGIALIAASIERKAGRKNGWLFQRYHKSFTRFVSLRENLKFEVVNLFGHLRNEYLLLGKTLFEKGIFSSIEQIFLLNSEEIQACVEGDVSILKLLPELLNSRQADQATCEQLQSPSLFSRIGEQIIPLEGVSSTMEEALKGIPCCRGVVSAPAYLLQSLDGHLEQIPPGSVLVAPSIDPGLTPLFVNAVGLVTEIGGMLSHGATLAREFGLPTVVGVPHIMDKISNQQIITVDGYRGLVFLSPPGERDEK